MTNYVIVAIPRVDEDVWKVSSEPVPHMTILNLGENVDPDKLGMIKDYLEHVVETTLTRFGCSVDKRDVLGDKQADVLLFEKGWSTREIEEARGYLLKHFGIFEAYNQADQFPEWTPHLTLGYPTNPAKKVENVYLNYVSFDRIALWNGDYEGWEFDLPRHDALAESPDVAYHDAVTRVKNSMNLDRPLSDASDVLAHAKKSKSFDDIMKSLDEDEKDLFDIVLGSLALGEEIPEELGFGDVYDDMDPAKQNALHFVVGTFLGNKDSYFEHDSMYDDSYLEHYGVKGMKWGVVREKTSGATQKFANAAAAKKAVVKESVIKATAKVSGINNNPKYKGKDLTKNPGLKAQYDAEALKAFRTTVTATASTVVVGGTALALSGVVPTFVTSAVGGIVSRPLISRSSSAGPYNTSKDSNYDGEFDFDLQTNTLRDSTNNSTLFNANDSIGHAEGDETDEVTSYSVKPKRDAQGFIIDFTVRTRKAEHDAMDGPYLCQFGVKGMKWGVRKDRYGPSGRLSKTTDKADRALARARVKSGTATLGEAHLAATKSTGHRVVNAVVGDKRYWANELKIAGLMAAGLGATAGAAFGLPDDIMTGIAEKVTGAKDVGGYMVLTNPDSGFNISSGKSSDIGRQIVGSLGVYGTLITTGAAATTNNVASTVRAFRGNKNVDKSYAKLGESAARRQYEGTKATKKLLKKDGGLRGKRLKQSMDLDRPYIAEEAARKGDAVQFGVKGMKWGVRRRRGADGRVVKGKPAPTKAQRKALAKSGLHTLSDEDLKKLTDRINLETNYKNAVTNASALKQINNKSRNLVDLGRTANDAISFAASPAGQLLLNQISPSLAKSASSAASLGKAAKQVSEKGNSANKPKKEKESKKLPVPKPVNLPDARQRARGPFAPAGGVYPTPFY